MIRGSLFTLAVLLSVIGGTLLFVGTVRSAIMTGANGTLIDFAGSSPPCPHCQHPYTASTGGYCYRCEKCRQPFECRLDESGHMQFEK